MRFFYTCRVSAAYERKVDAGEIQRDEAQVALAAKLDALHGSISLLPPVAVRTDTSTNSCSTSINPLLSVYSYFRNKFLSRSYGPPVRGIYIHGPVGVGKSFLMDLFYASVNVPFTKRSDHFHEFMLDVHHRIFVYKQKHPRGDAIPIVAKQLAREAQLLCYDHDSLQ